MTNTEVPGSVAARPELGPHRDESRPRARLRDLPLTVRTIGTAIVIAAVYGVLPTIPAAGWLQVVAWGSVLIVLRGARRHGARSLAWPLVAAGSACFAAGDLLFLVYEDILHRTPFPSVADVLYLAGYPLTALGLGLLVRRSRSGGGNAAFIDAGILVVPAAVIAWIYLVDPLASDSELSVFARMISAAYPLFDLVCLAVLVRLLVGYVGSRGAGQPALGMLVAGFVSMLGADAWFLVLSLRGADTDFFLLNAAFLLPYIGLAAAACDPSIARIGSAADAPKPPLTRRRLAVLAFAALIAPLLLALRHATGQDLAVPLVVAGTIVSFLLVIARMSGLVLELEASRAILQFEAAHDMLTGLPNRHEFDRRLRQVLDGGRPGALLFIDLDHFKEINDSLGHAAGDEVLIEVASRLRSQLREQDFAARLAGDEFVVMTAMDDDTDALLLAERLLRELAVSRDAGGRELRVHASIGVVRWAAGTTAEHAEELLQEADRAMYEAKLASGNQLAVRFQV